jgi:hypothetical protein
MKTIRPASVIAETSEVSGVTFFEAAGSPGNVGRCLWPLGGAGADMVVCGASREAASSYCPTHRKRAGSGQFVGRRP